jgi:hypothetical protein
MPYKDPQNKREWEWQHRVRRLARRRELRQIDGARKQARPEALGVNDRGASLLLPVVAGGALAAHNPKLAMGAGGLMLLSAVIYKKGWDWWIVAILILALGLFFYWSKQSAEKRPRLAKKGIRGRARWNDPQAICRCSSTSF